VNVDTGADTASILPDSYPSGGRESESAVFIGAATRRRLSSACQLRPGGNLHILSHLEISLLTFRMLTADGYEIEIVENNHQSLFVELTATGERRQIWASDLTRTPDQSVWDWLPYWSASLDVPDYVLPVKRPPRVADDRPSQWERLLGPDLF
jgi:hypothetical protein